MHRKTYEGQQDYGNAPEACACQGLSYGEEPHFPHFPHFRSEELQKLDRDAPQNIRRSAGLRQCSRGLRVPRSFLWRGAALPALPALPIGRIAEARSRCTAKHTKVSRTTAMLPRPARAKVFLMERSRTSRTSRT